MLRIYGFLSNCRYV